MTIGHFIHNYTFTEINVNIKMTKSHYFYKTPFQTINKVYNIGMAGIIATKKEEKRKRLLDAAYELFTKNGVSNTTIAQICEKANIAKGTFYLYFTDKEDILRTLLKKFSYMILDDFYKKIKDTDTDFVSKVIEMADFLLEFFKKDHDTLLVIKKDFIWPISEEEFSTTDEEPMKTIREDIKEYAEELNISEHQILVRIYSLLSMLCSISYSSIIDGFPGDIDSLKPELFEMIRKVLS